MLVFYYMKKCTKCKEEKNLENFQQDKSKKDGYYPSCKLCSSKRKKEYYLLNKHKIKKIDKQEKSLYNKDYIMKNKERIYPKNKKWREDNKDKVREYKKAYNKNNVLLIKERSGLYYKKNKIKIDTLKKQWYNNNKERVNSNHRRYLKERKQNDSLFKLSCAIRTNIYYSFKRYNSKFRKNNRTEKILGCSMIEFVNYISSLFTEDMSLDNYGRWHIDHIIPLASAKTEEEIIKLCHHENLQPLWAIDNLKKGSKII